MLIALDYDGTSTKSPAFWDLFCAMAKETGNEVICFTMRYPSEPTKMPCQIVYTGRKAKAKFVADNGYKVDIWIDDDPLFLIEDAA